MQKPSENGERSRQIQAQRQSTLRMAADAVQDLGSLLERRVPIAGPADATLLAALAVGRRLGVEIEPPQGPRTSPDARGEGAPEPFEAIARASHLRIRPVRLRDGWWREDSGPLLAYRKAGHLPVALLPQGSDRYECFDPTAQLCTPVTAGNEDRFERQAFLLYRSLPAGPVKTLDLVRYALRDRWSDLIGVLLIGVFISILGMASIQAVGLIVDHAIPRGDRSLLIQIGLGLVALGLGIVVAEATRGIQVIRLESFADHTLQSGTWDRLLALKVPFFREEPSGDVLMRATAIGQIRGTLNGATLQSVLISIFGLLNLALLWIYSWQFALLALSFAAVVAGVTLVACLLILRQTTELLTIQGRMLSLTVHLIQMISKIRVAAAEERAFAYWAKKYSQQQKLALQIRTIQDAVAIFNDLAGLASTMALFGLAIGLIRASGGTPVLTLGTMLASLAAYGAFLGCARALSNSVVQVFQVVNLWKRARPVLQAETEVTSVRVDPGRLLGRIRVEHVSFRYRDEGPLVLKDVSLRAEPGEFVAVVGSSGSGKSTLVRLLLGFETPGSGRVLFDDHELSSLDLRAVRSQLGVVLQNDCLFRGTIYENIANGALLSMEDADAAVRLAGLAEELARLPLGMYTHISEDGSNFSGGQRQRLLLARALASRPRILILDEATSSLDNRIQAQIIAGLDRLQVTRIVIAHRLSTVRHADRIYVLEQGVNAQEGTYHELARQEGPFARFLARQQA
jgi:NHLM bacteriocin system ABC transporter ATP-binding protein